MAPFGNSGPGALRRSPVLHGLIEMDLCINDLHGLSHRFPTRRRLYMIVYRQKLDDWYMHNGGEIPKWVTFMGKHRPQFLKAYRLSWEGVFRGALPKQCMLFMMIYHNVTNVYRDGLREAALPRRAWGMTTDWILLAVIACAYYYTGFEGLNVLEDAIGDIL
jgi:hypothetical protein